MDWGRKQNGFIECDYCGEWFVEGEPFCPYCARPVEKILEAIEKKQKEKQEKRKCFSYWE